MIKEARALSGFGSSLHRRPALWAKVAMVALLLAIIALTTFAVSGCSSVGAISLFPVQSADKFGYIDQTGRVIITPQYDRVGLFVDGLAPVWVGDDVGYIDTRGTIKIKPQFDSAGSFSDGIAPVLVNMRVGFINESGNYVVQPTYSDAAPFDEGLAPVKQGTKWGFINESGKVAIPFSFDDVGSFTDGLARAKSGEKWGYIDASGTFVIQPQYVATDTVSQPVLHFESDRAAVYVDGSWRYIDKSGKQAFQQTFFQAGEFSEGLAPVVVNVSTKAGEIDYRLGFIDTSGKMTIKPQFDSGLTITNPLATGFHNGLAVVRQTESPGLWGYINEDGKYVIQPKYDYASSFYWGPVASVELDGYVVYIDESGRVLFKGTATAGAITPPATTPTTVAPVGPEGPSDADVSADTSISTTTSTITAPGS